MTRLPLLAVAVLLALPGAASAADSVMVQCGQQYQAAKAAGTLNGANWNQYRTDCAARLKAQPAAATAATAATAAAPTPVPAAAPSAPAAAPPAAAATTAKPLSGGQAAMRTRQKQCGAEWRAQKVTLVAQTPGLTWPKYWSQCNTRLKAAGQ